MVDLLAKNPAASIVILSRVKSMSVVLALPAGGEKTRVCS
jgi:hypothetical protein